MPIASLLIQFVKFLADNAYHVFSFSRAFTTALSTYSGGATEGARREGCTVGISLLANGDIKYECNVSPHIVKWALGEHYTGDILQHITTASVRTRRNVCRNLLFIVHELHEEGIIHGSICAANVKWNSGTVSLSNAGLFAEIQYQVEQVPLLPCTRYRTKEEMECDEYTPSVDGDLYALTVLIYAIFAGKEPYNELSLQRCVSTIAHVGHTGLAKPEIMPLTLWSAFEEYWSANCEDRGDAFGRVKAFLN